MGCEGVGWDVRVMCVSEVERCVGETKMLKRVCRLLWRSVIWVSRRRALFAELTRDRRGRCECGDLGPERGVLSAIVRRFGWCRGLCARPCSSSESASQNEEGCLVKGHLERFVDDMQSSERNIGVATAWNCFEVHSTFGKR